MKDYSTVQQTGILEFFKKCIVPIVLNDRGNIGILATGSLFHIAGKRYLLTARHIFEGPGTHIGVPLLQNRVLIPVPGDSICITKSAILPLTGVGAIIHKPDTLADRQCDMALVEIPDSGIGTKLDENYVPLTSANLHPMKVDPKDCLVVGYSNSATVRVQQEVCYRLRVIRSTPLPLSCAGGTQLDLPIDPCTDLLLGYGKELHDSSGKNISAPDLYGMSGCLVWAWVHSNGTPQVWTPENDVKAIAIQVSFVQSRFIRTKTIKILHAMLKQINQAGASEIEKALWPNGWEQ